MIERLKNFPISFFALILGLSGITIASQKAVEFIKIHEIVASFMIFFTCFVFTLVTVVYLIKIVKYPKEVKAELQHPARLSFFPAFTISFILLSIVFININNSFSYYLLVIGAVGHLLFSLYILTEWITNIKYNVVHISPAWFIPVVGNILVPIPASIHFHEDISWFFYSIGFILWIVLLTIFMYRAFFDKPLPEKLIPTFFILIAPPAIGFISYVKLVGEIDSFAKIMYFFAVFTFILLLAMFRSFIKINFFLSWWAYTFPIAAITISSFLMFYKSQIIYYKYFATITYGMLLIIFVFLVYRTIKEAIAGKICVPE